MSYSAVNAVINLETLYWMPQSLEVSDGAVPDGEGVVNMWPGNDGSFSSQCLIPSSS